MRPLSKKTRTLMFILLSLVFIIGAPVLILYSTGYRLGDALSLIKTGGIFIHSNLSGTRVYVDGDFVEDNGIILRNTLIQNLRPNKTYNVKVEKEGHNTWEKDFRVLPNLVIEAKVLMLPEEIEFREISDPKINPEYKVISELFKKDSLGQFEVVVSTTTPKIVAGVKKLVTSTSTEVSIPKYISNLEIEEIEEKNLLREKQKMLSWLENGKVNVVWVGDEASLPYLFCGEKCQDKIVVSYKEPILYYDFMPGREDVFIILTSSGIRAIEIDNRSKINIQDILIGDNLDFRVENNNTIFIKDDKVFKEVVF